MDPVNVLRNALEVIDTFVSEVEASDDEEDFHAARRKISQLNRLIRDFYVALFCSKFDLEISGFAYRDKRRVARTLVERENPADVTESDLTDEELELAAYFEDFSDLLHGDIEFGYSGDDDAYTQFHEETFPTWLYLLEEWLRAIGEDALAADVRVKARKYNRVI